MENEVWKDVVGFEGYYQVSNLGNVRSLGRVIIKKGYEITGRIKDEKGQFTAVRSNDKVTIPPTLQKIKPKILRGTINQGYKKVCLTSANGDEKLCTVHSLISRAFVPNPDPDNLTTVHHIDGNKLNNVPGNFQWVSPNNHTEIHEAQRKAERAKSGKRKESKLGKPVIATKQHGTVFEVKIYPSIIAAARQLGGHDSRINAAVKHRNGAKTAYGYQWQYLE